MSEFKKPVGRPTYSKETSSLFHSDEDAKDDLMEEEAYLREMSKIIRRDFFPEKMTEQEKEEQINGEGSAASKMSLNEFIRKIKSEDNETFKNIMEREEEKWRQKYWWMFLAEKKDRVNQLALENGDNREKDNLCRMILPHPDKKLAITDVEAHNNLFFMPPKVENKEIQPTLARSEKMNYANTRFDPNIVEAEQHKNAKKFLDSIAVDTDTKALSTPFLLGILDSDSVPQAHSKRPFRYNLEELMHGKANSEVNKQPPIINGFQMQTMPSPAPSVMPSPLITWGEIEDAPVKLNEQKTFKIREVSEREKVAYSLTTNVQKQKSIQKKANQEIMKKAINSGTPHKVAAILSSAQGNHLIKSLIARKLTSSRVVQSSTKTPSQIKPIPSTPSNKLHSAQAPITQSYKDTTKKSETQDETPLLNF